MYIHAHPAILVAWKVWRKENTWVIKMLTGSSHWPSYVEEPPAALAAAPARVTRALTLPSGGQMPTSGLGMCCRMSALGEDARKAVLWYLLLGGRHIDTAEAYSNAAEIGQGIREAVQRGVPRSEIFLTTKTPPQGYDRTMAWFSADLQRLGLDYVDLVLVHHPGIEGSQLIYGCATLRECRSDTWRALSELRARGAIRDIGVSNFGPQQIGELQALRYAPVAVNQLEYHPFVSRTYHEVVDFCHRRGIAVTAYCSMGGPETKDTILAREHLARVSALHGKTPGQVLLRWAIQKNTSVIPGTSNPRHMLENMDIYDFQLSEGDMVQLEATEDFMAFRDEYVGVPDLQS